MKVEKKELSRGQAELKITLNEVEYEPFLKRAALEISESIEISGFRKGKAPYDIIKKQVGEQKIYEQAVEFAIKKTLIKALEQEKLISVGSPKIEVEKLAPGNPIIYKATLNLLPSVELSNLSEIEIIKNSVEITKDQVDKALNDLRKMRGKEILVNRETRAGDKAIINFTVSLDKVIIEGGEQKNFPLILGEGQFIPDFEKNILGLKKDEEKEFKANFPKNYHQKNLAGREVEFKVKMLNVYKIELPKLDDEFAKNLGHGFKDLEDLRKQMENNLKQEAEIKEEQRIEEKILDETVAKSKFSEIPDILINTEVKKMISELEHNLTQQGLKFDDYLEHLKKKRSDLMLDFAPAANKRVKSALLMRKVAEREKIKASDEEADAEISKLKQSFANNKEMEQRIESAEYREYVRNVLTSKKVMDYLKKKVVR